jgi:hypothetical protein
MFSIYSRRGQTTIYAVECEKITPMQDPSILWLPQGEYMARVLAPAVFHEPVGTGPEVVQPIYHSHAFYSTAAEAMAQVEVWVRAPVKRGTPKTEEEIQATLAAVKVVLLGYVDPFIA